MLYDHGDDVLHLFAPSADVTLRIAAKAAHLQADGFGSDSVRLIRQLQHDSSSLQILLFSATFNERVRTFAQKVAGSEANQVAIRLNAV